ncbi:unnamed protein product [Ilex paraguariensis]|uniref:Uncharacterized protein n=1 Tax=Ilex paraguariensis TaxID=185542 RepID=A0ABC8SRX6_9AQUA
MGSVKKLAKKVMFDRESSQYECLPRERELQLPSAAPTGFFSLAMLERRDDNSWCQPERPYDEFGFEQSNGLVVPFSVTAFQEVVNAVECCNGRFDFGNLVDEFI